MENSNTGSVPGGQTTPLTFGQKAVGITFNPGGDLNVAKAKQLCAEAIDLLIATPFDVGSEGAAMKEEAIRQLQTAQMWAVKVITWKE
ncbi:MAG: hypothetical protein NT155_03615 [Candidatus Staskawiczbacteria bacterium]|nr:hypothetical protein [Candidatus Staskawiczbacteria bacterium]